MGRHVDTGRYRARRWSDKEAEMDAVVIVTRATRDHVGFRFWNGTEDVTKDLRFMMDTAQADEDTPACVDWLEKHTRTPKTRASR